ncbi:tRNA wybutosine-synthesizing protein, partial [Kalaharituber pfeilii]
MTSVTASTIFQQRKAKILAGLALHSRDASPKGYVDDEILALVSHLNREPGVVTTSSCAGRVAVFLEGVKRKLGQSDEPILEEGSSIQDDPNYSRTEVSLKNGVPTEQVTSRPAGIGGKGHGGQWLYVCHNPAKLELLSWVNLCREYPTGYHCCMDEITKPEGSHHHNHSVAEDTRFLHFKFEPMILHVMTESIGLAQKILKLAISAGFRESGIMNPTAPATLAIRTTGLAFDCIIGHFHPSTLKICQTVDDAYLGMLAQVAYARFAENERRRNLFSDMLQRDSPEGPLNWEDKDKRRERKRAEGLVRSSQLKAQSSVMASSVSQNREETYANLKDLC